MVVNDVLPEEAHVAIVFSTNIRITLFTELLERKMLAIHIPRNNDVRT